MQTASKAAHELSHYSSSLTEQNPGGRRIASRAMISSQTLLKSQLYHEQIHELVLNCVKIAKWNKMHTALHFYVNG